ncbi:hypothetical protein [Halomonas sp. 328]|uniref:hypothetical protein n=1 Tax=Halomonas sp. 328 TaxID=2776704 RepID=UPI0018A7001A|nr:hypothetical protein [Halomonas sp. 328]MBF8224524.1 hypothetical protein [Halomonas sp. 328]
MSLSPLVQLYRLVKAPAIMNGRIEAETEFGDEVRDLVNQVRQDTTLGRFLDIEVDEEDCTDEDPLPVFGRKLSFEFLLSTGGAERFYRNFDDLINSNASISSGHAPGEFYLVEERCYSRDQGLDPCVESLGVFCDFVKKLSCLAHYHDAKATASGLNLVFIHPEEGGGQSTVAIKAKADPRVVSKAGEMDLSLLSSLCDNDQTTDMHYHEKLNVFSSTLIDFVKGDKARVGAFDHLVDKWDEFVDLYNKNIGTYMSGFAFHKAKREVAEAEVSISEQFSKILSDITTRVLSIPLSFAAIVALIKSEGFWESYFIVVGIFLASLIISQLVSNQQRQFNRVVKSKALVLGSFEGRREVYPEDLRNHLEDLEVDLDNHEKRVRRTLWVFRVLSWAPVFSALLVFMMIYTNWFS